MNHRAASRAVSKIATPNNGAASCGVFTSRESGIKKAPEPEKAGRRESLRPADYRRFRPSRIWRARMMTTIETPPTTISIGNPTDSPMPVCGSDDGEGRPPWRSRPSLNGAAAGCGVIRSRHVGMPEERKKGTFIQSVPDTVRSFCVTRIVAERQLTEDVTLKYQNSQAHPARTLYISERPLGKVME